MPSRRRNIVPFGSHHGNRPIIRRSNNEIDLNRNIKSQTSSTNRITKKSSKRSTVPICGKENEEDELVQNDNLDEIKQQIQIKRSKSKKRIKKKHEDGNNRSINILETSYNSQSKTPKINNLANIQKYVNASKIGKKKMLSSRINDGVIMEKVKQKKCQVTATDKDKIQKKKEKELPSKTARETMNFENFNIWKRAQHRSVDNQEVIAVMLESTKMSKEEEISESEIKSNMEGRLIGDNLCESADESELTMYAFHDETMVGKIKRWKKTKKSISQSTQNIKDDNYMKLRNYQFKLDEKNLPAGWSIKFSKSKPNRYYYHHAIHGTTWKHPATRATKTLFKIPEENSKRHILRHRIEEEFPDASNMPDPVDVSPIKAAQSTLKREKSTAKKNAFVKTSKENTLKSKKVSFSKKKL